MSRRILLLTYTYFQLITAVQLRLTLLKKDSVDIVITNHSAGCKEVAARLTETGLFESVFYAEDREQSRHNGTLEKLLRFLPARLSPDRQLEKMISLPSDYDQIWFNNAITFTHLVWKHCPKAALIRFE